MPVTATPTRAAEFRENLGQRVWVADGAMGTMLYSKGAFINRCYDELNLSLPALVRDVHQEYVLAEARSIFREQIEALVEAGVDCLMLETFRDLNEVRAAVEAARDAAGSEMV